MALKLGQSLLARGCIRCLHDSVSMNEFADLRATCRSLAEKELKPIASRLDKECMFPNHQIQMFGSLGLMGVLVPKCYGGAGLNAIALTVIVTEISRCCAGTGAIVNIHNALYADVINSHGSEEQKNTFLPTFVNGKHVGSFALSEPGSGSDAAGMLTTADPHEDGWLINGSKAWVTNGYEAKAVLVFAVTSRSRKNRGISAFIIPIPSEGLVLGKKEDKLGIRASSTCSIHFENVKVGRENLLGKENDGFKIAMSALNCARIGIAAQAVGIAEASLDCAIEYAQKRTAFGSPILKLQAVQNRIARMAAQLEAARTLTHAAASARDRNVVHVKEASIAKLVASEAATAISHQCIQILGGMGYVSDMPAERHYRDARITEIYGGPTDIQLLLIADHVARGYGYSTR